MMQLIKNSLIYNSILFTFYEFKNNWKLLIGMIFLYIAWPLAIIIAVLTLISYFTITKSFWLVPMIFLGFSASLIFSFFYFIYGITILSLSMYSHQKPPCIIIQFPFMRIFILYFIRNLIVGFGIVLFIIPGLLAYWATYFYLQIIVEQKRTIRETFTISTRLAKKCIGSIVCVDILYWMVIILMWGIAKLCEFMTPLTSVDSLWYSIVMYGKIIFEVLSVICSVVMGVFTTFMTTYIYKHQQSLSAKDVTNLGGDVITIHPEGR